MTRKHLFTDEAGDFTFQRGPNVSRYFIVCSVALDSCECGEKLLQLRRQLAWEKLPLGDGFHATSDQQVVRDRVYEALADTPMRIDATILEKSKAYPRIRQTKEQFYQYAWYYHFKLVGPAIAKDAKELHLTTASIGTKKGQAVYTAAVNNVVQQVLRRVSWVTTFASAQSDPCLQIADYCTWAIQRKWERGDERSYSLIKDRIATEFDLFERGATHYY